MADTISALIIGDIIGHPGMRALFAGLSSLIKKYSADIVLVNAENAADGFGLSAEQAQKLLDMSVDVITTGNHIWHDESVFEFMDRSERIVRPANYPKGAPGKGSTLYDKGDITIGVLNILGRQRLWTVDCPFKKATEELKKLRQKTNLIFVDFHAESTAEKEAMGFYLDGKVTAVVGTHTHVQTADERILPGGTAYITDLGATSPEGTVIGFDAELAVKRVTTQVPHQLNVVDAPATICGVHVVADKSSGKALSIERLQVNMGL
ncbi:TIGR00282 family metallophosphoesterase [Spirochaetia bacterium 38H-sp]|uniref:TIGR00282 family metallophosphoesterase n=1 Tax=Rarispira pelagica TaxID=3141764 RepID=A0ABU9UBA1_9SPIR